MRFGLIALALLVTAPVFAEPIAEPAAPAAALSTAAAPTVKAKRVKVCKGEIITGSLSPKVMRCHFVDAPPAPALTAAIATPPAATN